MNIENPNKAEDYLQLDYRIGITDRHFRAAFCSDSCRLSYVGADSDGNRKRDGVSAEEYANRLRNLFSVRNANIGLAWFTCRSCGKRMNGEDTGVDHGPDLRGDHLSDYIERRSMVLAANGKDAGLPDGYTQYWSNANTGIFKGSNMAANNKTSSKANSNDNSFFGRLKENFAEDRKVVQRRVTAQQIVAVGTEFLVAGLSHGDSEAAKTISLALGTNFGQAFVGLITSIGIEELAPSGMVSEEVMEVVREVRRSPATKALNDLVENFTGPMRSIISAHIASIGTGAQDDGSYSLGSGAEPPKLEEPAVVEEPAVAQQAKVERPVVHVQTTEAKPSRKPAKKVKVKVSQG